MYLQYRRFASPHDSCELLLSLSLSGSLNLLQDNNVHHFFLWRQSSQKRREDDEDILRYIQSRLMV